MAQKLAGANIFTDPDPIYVTGAPPGRNTENNVNAVGPISALVGDDQALFVAWQDAGWVLTNPRPKFAVTVASSTDGQRFHPVTQVNPIPSAGAQLAPLTFADPVSGNQFPQTGSGAVALALFNERLWVAWADEATQYIYLADTNTGGDAGELIQFLGSFPLSPRPGEPPAIETIYSGAGPTMCVFGGFLYIAWPGTNKQLNLAWSADGYHWTYNQMSTAASTCYEVGMAVLDGTLFVVWTDSGSGGLKSMSTPGTDDGLPNFTTATTLTFSGPSVGTSGGGASMTTYNGTMYLAWTNSQNGYVQVATSTDGQTWSNTPQPMAGSTATPAIVAFVPAPGTSP